MKPSLLEYLACPSCTGHLDLVARVREEDEVMEGDLRCAACAVLFPVEGGIPRFVGAGLSGTSSRTASAFGWEWRTFSTLEDRYERQFLDWIAPVTPEMFRGRVVLEGGCGKGRHTRLVASYGARAVIGVDLSDAVDVAFANTRAETTAHIIQADLLQLPLRPASCDHAFSIGVLHHLERPDAGFHSLARAVRPGGAISVWVYGAENNAWITRVVSPLRAVTSRLPHRGLYWLTAILTVPLWVVLRLLYRPALRPERGWLRRILFYQPYLSYISRFPFREIHHIVHDHLTAPVAHYLTRDEVERWYRDAGAVETVIAWHNRNSWRGHGDIAGGSQH